ncbi:MAG: hypothetical protein RLZZ205_193 [Bacteroidota bacterium]|jgi:hypothetical protein
MKIRWVTLVLGFLSSLSWGQSDVAPKYVNEFLNIGVGARGYALAGAITGTSKDGFSSYWNPAGIARIPQQHSIAAMHAEYFAGIAKLDYAGYAQKLDNYRNFGASFIRFGVDNIPNTIDLYDPNGNVDYSRISYFSAADYAFLLTYAQSEPPKILKRFLPKEKMKNHFGINAKIIYRQIGEFANAWGFGIDLGWQAEYKKWEWGVVLKDITGTFSAWHYNLDDKTKSVFLATGNELPDNAWEIAKPRIITGGGRNFFWRKYQFIIEGNLITTTDGKRNTLIAGNTLSIDPAIGMEIGYQQWLKLRAGFGNFQRTTTFQGQETTFQPNIGLGIVFKQFSLDYALTDIANQSDVLYTNMVSLTFNGLLPKRQVNQGS